jgi:hypothetical protein
MNYSAMASQIMLPPAASVDRRFRCGIYHRKNHIRENSLPLMKLHTQSRYQFIFLVAI